MCNIPQKKSRPAQGAGRKTLTPQTPKPFPPNLCSSIKRKKKEKGKRKKAKELQIPGEPRTVDPATESPLIPDAARGAHPHGIDAPRAAAQNEKAFTIGTIIA